LVVPTGDEEGEGEKGRPSGLPSRPNEGYSCFPGNTQEKEGEYGGVQKPSVYQFAGSREKRRGKKRAAASAVVTFALQRRRKKKEKEVSPASADSANFHRASSPSMGGRKGKERKFPPNPSPGEPIIYLPL